ncbi:MAG: riboflavin biosynthesis protein RibF [Burkholderiales bacterium]|nr:riboflavin biosynthesis protein RibF [Burkholderiales bacterium]
MIFPHSGVGFFYLGIMFRLKLSSKTLQANQPIIATIGNFDGFHLGHQELLGQLNQLANAQQAWRMLITFDVLPHEYFADKAGILRSPRIGLLRDKIQIIQASGMIDEVVVLHFNQALAQLTPREFIQKILLERLQISDMLVGHDFRFGNQAQGSIADLRASGIVTSEFAELKHQQLRVSSSLIRELAADQNLAMIQSYLGHNICYTSRVVKGNQLARKWNFPTINLNLYKIRPVLWGIYTSYVYIDGQRYFGVTNIGKNPTVSEGKVYKIETHLLDVDLDLYSKIAAVEILHFLRPELKFDGLEPLFKQMYQDLADARAFFAKIKE